MVWREVFQAIFSSVIIYLLLLVATRIIGKKLLSQLTFFDFVTGITIGTIGGAFVTTQVRGYYVLIGVVNLTFFVYLTGKLSIKNVTARKLIEGEPLVIMQNGKIFEDNMRKIRYNQDDLLMQLRDKDVFDLGEVEFAILEPNGKLSVLKKSQNQPLTPKDMKLPSDYKGVSTEIIRDGKIEEENLVQNKLTHEWLFKQLTAQDVKQVEDVFLATLATNGNLYLDLRNDSMPYIQEIEEEESVIH